MPDDPKNTDSLGDDRTFAGERDVPVEEQQSLGDQATAGDALSSISDLELDGQVSDSDLPLIDLAARFEIEGELGKGGMGAVQLATDRQLKRKVAIKRIHASNSSALARFVTEAQSIAALNHFNIVQIYEFGRDEEGPLLVMEYVSGGSLLDRLKDGKLEVEDAIGITCQLCDALAVAHEQGIIHRDIKPANILLTTRGEPKLTDFGLARQESVDHGQTQAGAVLGTIDFMPPEQRRDATSVDARSDLWSLAATLYQMITGSSPRVIRLDQLPANLSPVIGKMLEENPGQRYATAEEFKTELRKGMATAAATVAVDLAAGVCPACNTANDGSRKFCRGCRASLFEPCMSCESDQPVWEDVCGQCGTSQQEQRNLIREKLAAAIEKGLTLARAHEYEEALLQLNAVQEDEHAFTEDIRGQAAGQVSLVTTQRDEQHQLRDQLVELADQHEKANDYAAAVKVLEKIPAPLRTDNPIAEKLSNAQAARDELSSLLQEISEGTKNSRIDGLLEKTARVLELNPKHSEAQELREQLLERQQQAIKQAAELLDQAEQQFSQCEDQAVLTTLANWPQALQCPARVGQLQTMATDRLARVQELNARITAETRVATKLLLIEEYILLRPGDEQAGHIAEDLRQQQQQADQKTRKTRKILIVGGASAAALILLVAVLWNYPSYNARAAFAAKKAFLEKAAAESVVTLEGHSGVVTSVSFSPDGRRIISGSWDSTLKVWDAETGQLALTLKGLSVEMIKLPVSSVSFSPDGRRIVSGSWDNKVKVWAVRHPRETLTLKGHSGSVYSVSFSPDGKRIVSGSSDNTLKIWDTETGQELLTLNGHSGYVYSVRFSPDGKRIVSGGFDNTLKIWDAETGQETRTLKGHSNLVTSVSFSPDGRRIVSGSFDKTLKVWDAETGQGILTLEGHSGGVTSVSFSPDGRRIVSGSGDKTLKVWDADTGAELLTLKGHSDYVKSVSFSPDGRRIVSGSGDKTLKVWDTRPLEVE